MAQPLSALITGGQRIVYTYIFIPQTQQCCRILLQLDTNFSTFWAWLTASNQSLLVTEAGQLTSVDADSLCAGENATDLR